MVRRADEMRGGAGWYAWGAPGIHVLWRVVRMWDTCGTRVGCGTHVHLWHIAAGRQAGGCSRTHDLLLRWQLAVAGGGPAAAVAVGSGSSR